MTLEDLNPITAIAKAAMARDKDKNYRFNILEYTTPPKGTDFRSLVLRSIDETTPRQPSSSFLINKPDYKGFALIAKPLKPNINVNEIKKRVAGGASLSRALEDEYIISGSRDHLTLVTEIKQALESKGYDFPDEILSISGTAQKPTLFPLSSAAFRQEKGLRATISDEEKQIALILGEIFSEVRLEPRPGKFSKKGKIGCGILPDGKGGWLDVGTWAKAQQAFDSVKLPEDEKVYNAMTFWKWWSVKQIMASVPKAELFQALEKGDVRWLVDHGIVNIAKEDIRLQADSVGKVRQTLTFKSLSTPWKTSQLVNIDSIKDTETYLSLLHPTCWPIWKKMGARSKRVRLRFAVSNLGYLLSGKANTLMHSIKHAFPFSFLQRHADFMNQKLSGINSSTHSCYIMDITSNDTAMSADLRLGLVPYVYGQHFGKLVRAIAEFIVTPVFYSRFLKDGKTLCATGDLDDPSAYIYRGSPSGTVDVSLAGLIANTVSAVYILSRMNLVRPTKASILSLLRGELPVKMCIQGDNLMVFVPKGIKDVFKNFAENGSNIFNEDDRFLGLRVMSEENKYKFFMDPFSFIVKYLSPEREASHPHKQGSAFGIMTNYPFLKKSPIVSTIIDVLDSFYRRQFGVSWTDDQFARGRIFALLESDKAVELRKLYASVPPSAALTLALNPDSIYSLLDDIDPLVLQTMTQVWTPDFNQSVDLYLDLAT